MSMTEDIDIIEILQFSTTFKITILAYSKELLWMLLFTGIWLEIKCGGKMTGSPLDIQTRADAKCSNGQ